MNTAFYNFLATAASGELSHIGLVDDQGDELSGGSYARQAVTWESPNDGLIRPDDDLVFDVPGGNTVAGWRAYNDSSGGTDYEGASLDPEPYTNDGEFRLLAAQTFIDIG